MQSGEAINIFFFARATDAGVYTDADTDTTLMIAY